MTLDEALATAFEKHPELATARSGIELRRAFVRAAGVYPFNPALTLAGNARVADRTSADFEVGLEQELEIAGQRGKRRAVAAVELDVVTAHANRLLRQLAAQVRAAFVRAAAQQGLLEIAKAELEISTQLVVLAQRRMEAGAGTQLEIAVARAEASKTAENANSVAGEYAVARAELAFVMGLADGQLPEPSGQVAEDEGALAASLSELMKAARENREDLVALRLNEMAAKERIELAHAEAWPNLTVGAFVGQEASDELLAGGSLGIPIPLFNRNQGGIAVAEAELTDAQAQTALAEQDALLDVVAAYQQYQAARLSLQSLEANVVTTEEALRLLRRSFETGKSTWVEVLVMRRTLFDAQRALVRTRATAHLARIRLDMATGTTPVPRSLRLEAAR